MDEFSVSSDPNQALGKANGVSAMKLSMAALREQFRPALLSVLVLTLLSGALFPSVLFVLARPFFPTQASGSLLTREGAIIGSELIGQSFTAPGYFHPRPSAAGTDDAAASSGQIQAPPILNSKTERPMILKPLTLTSPLQVSDSWRRNIESRIGWQQMSRFLSTP